MAIVTEISWDDMLDGKPLPETPARKAWRAAVAEIAEKAKATLPQCNGRVDKAVALVLNGDVELLPDGKAQVASQSNGTTQYCVVNGECSCKDFPKAPSNWCKHRIAAGLAKRATPLAKAKLEAATHSQAGPPHPPAPAQPQTASIISDTPSLPEGLKPFIVHLHGKPFVQYAGLLFLAHERGLVSLTADWTHNDPELSLAHAVALFEDGRRFEESGDATPANTNRKVAVHFRRVALTRAKARALRDALGVDLVAVEELEDVD
jgi:hypothetical protein